MLCVRVLAHAHCALERERERAKESERKREREREIGRRDIDCNPVMYTHIRV